MIRILLVEDDQQNWDMLSRRLARKGYEVLLATDGQQAVEQTRQQRPDLILMDINLPVMDGYEATAQIRELDDVGRTPIIALTAHAMAGDRERLLAAGCDDYHSKPVELPRLLEQIQALLRPERDTASDPAAPSSPESVADRDKPSE